MVFFGDFSYLRDSKTNFIVIKLAKIDSPDQHLLQMKRS